MTAGVRERVAAGDLSFLDEQVLHDWVIEQRWFAAKSRDVTHLHVLDAIPLEAGHSPLLVLAVMEARFPTGTHETYQVPLGLRSEDEGWSERIICAVDGWTVFDAFADPALALRFLQLVQAQERHGDVHFHHVEGAPELDPDVDVRPIGVEQSNTSVVFGDRLVMKAFRRVEAGDNPELELLHFLTSRRFPHIAPLAGWYEYEGRLIDATLGIVQEYLREGYDGWELTLDSVARGDREILADLEELGRVTGEMHAVLGSVLDDPRFAPESPSDELLSLLVATLDEQIERTWSYLPGDDERLAPIHGSGQDAREKLRELSQIGAGGRLIRTHGDYHLGQCMRTGRGWVILDFEGEPARPLPERRLKRSPLRDVAGMLRSFAYAATALPKLRDGAEAPPGWEERARESFLSGYFATVDPALLPPSEAATAKMLAVFELEKAVYELNYELNNRPDWVTIPVAGIARLLEAEIA